ncbi:MAG: thiamine phosphate synthase [Thermoanaerobaculia bacterium]
MRLIVVTSSGEHPDEVYVLNRLIDAGMRRLHVAKPDWSEGRVRSLLESLPANFQPHVTLDGHYALALDMDLGGIAISDAADESVRREFDRVRRLRPMIASCGRFHSLETLRTLAVGVTEAWISPVFASISKPAHEPSFSFEEMSSVVRELRIPAVALGGIRSDRIEPLKGAAVIWAAVLGAIWQSPDPIASFAQLREACR